MAIPRDPAVTTAGERSHLQIDPAIRNSIARASAASGIDFGTLMAGAAQESGFRPDAKAPSGTATGLFQFTEGTWLEMVRRHGAAHGLGREAAQIANDGAGRPSVADPAQRRAILDLRRDPALSAAFAAEYARSNKGEVERGTGRTAGATELYLAHFLGPTGAVNFLQAAATNGRAPAAELFPEAAAANRAVFYDEGGRARSVAEVYRGFSEKIGGSAARFAAAAGAPIGAVSPGAAIRPVGLASAALLPRLALADILTLSAIRLVAGTPADAETKRGAASL